MLSLQPESQLTISELTQVINLLFEPLLISRSDWLLSPDRSEVEVLSILGVSSQ